MGADHSHLHRAVYNQNKTNHNALRPDWFRNPESFMLSRYIKLCLISNRLVAARLFVCVVCSLFGVNPLMSSFFASCFSEIAKGGGGFRKHCQRRRLQSARMLWKTTFRCVPAQLVT